MTSPQTLLRWHRELVRRKWTYKRKDRGGRPPLDPAICELILRLGRENRRWGCVRVQGELAKLGVRVSATKIRTLLRRESLGPAPRRSGPTWSEFLRAQASGVLACDLFTVETLFLKTGYMQRDLVENRGWLLRKDFLNGVALGQVRRAMTHPLGVKD
jgi:hypothetical protein